MNAIAQKMPTVARLVLGLVFTVFGLNKLLQFLPQPPMSGPPAAFFMALMATGYMLPLVATTEIVAGVLLLGGRFAPLALTLLAPVIVNIVLFHALLAPGGLGVPLFVPAAEIYLAWVYRDAFAPMLRARVVPNARAIKTGEGGSMVGAVSAAT